MSTTELPASVRAFSRLGDWITLHADGTFDVRSGKVELGQGISAALIKLACMGLGAAPEQVRLSAGDTASCPDEGYTAGSQSIEVGGAALRHACDVLRQLASATAARHFGVPSTQLQVERGVFRVRGRTDALPYANALQGVDWAAHRMDAATSGETVGAEVVATPDAHFVRSDLRAKFTGAGFVHDLQPAGLLHARVLRGPHPASRPLGVDLAALQALDGVDKVVQKGDFLALAGADEARLVAAAALATGRVVWQTPELPACADAETVLTTLPAVTTVALATGSAGAADGGTRLTRRYSRPYIAHAAIGTACAVAVPGHAAAGTPLTVWSHTQGAFKLRDQIAQALQLTPAAVRVVHTPGAGCYGHNGADDVAFDAALLAQTLDAPVRVQWSRQDELAVSPMGSASLVELQAGLDDQGRITDWQAQVWSHTHLARPGWGAGVQLLGAWAADPATPAPAPADVPLPTGGGLRNAVPYYTLPALTVTHHFVPQAPVRVSALRSLGAHANVFAIESFMDELAAAAGVDALDFRLRHLDDERARQVLQTVARQAGWPQRGAGGEGRGLGLGYARYKNRGGYCAVAIEVNVTDTVRVDRVWAAVDAGAIVHADGLRNQIEGGIVQALSWSLKEAVRWGPQGVTTASWDDYPILGFAELPEVHVELIDQPAQPSLGAGELAPGPVAGALGNAVAHALGLRARHLPFTPERLLALIHAADADT